LRVSPIQASRSAANRLPVVIGLAAALARLVAAVEDVHPQAVETLAAGGLKPRDGVLADH
jgi:hypothetical protein